MSATAEWIIFRYEDVECEEKLWWVFLLSCAAFPTTLLLAVLTFRACRNLPKWTEPRGYAAVPMPSAVSADGEESEVTSTGGIRQTVAENPQTTENKIYWSEEVRRAASEIVSAQTLTGKIAVRKNIFFYHFFQILK